MIERERGEGRITRGKKGDLHEDDEYEYQEPGLMTWKQV